jgi:lipid-binding SYLF domain-containing protein
MEAFMITRRAVVAALPLAALARPAFATEEQDLVDRARITVDGFARDPEFAEMRRLLPRAKGVIVFPNIFKAGFIIGGEGGSGVLVGRDGKTGAWTAPAFYTLGAGSVGLQIGAEASEVMLLVMTDNGLRAVISNQVKLGADASIAVGPIGKGVEASTTTALRADIYSFAKSRGLFGGISLEGAVLAARDSWNQKYYGRTVSAEAIVLRREVEAANAALLQDSLRRAEARS